MKRRQQDRLNPLGVRGFTLLEVLIALVVLSIGLLGIAALQGVGLRSSHGAYLTSQASLLAYDFADRIRANPGMLAIGGNFATDDVDCPQDTSAMGLGEADRTEWACAIQSLLPAGSATVSRAVSTTITGASTVSIEIQWTDLQAVPDEGGDPAAVRPWQYALVIEI